MGTLKFGFASADITPELGTHLTGAVAEWRPAEAIVDRLRASVSVIESGGTRVAIVVLDVTMACEPYSGQIRDAAVAFGIPREAVLVHATQTHSAPSLGPFTFLHLELPDSARWITGDDEKYGEWVVQQTTQALRQAVDDLKPSSMAVASCLEGRYAFNRRAINKEGRAVMPMRRWLRAPSHANCLYLEGPIDPQLAVMAVRAEDETLRGCFLHYTSHPVHVFPRKTISADWPGSWALELTHRLRQELHTVVINGCCGDVNPWDHWNPDYVDDHHAMGKGLAERTQSLLDGMTYSEDGEIRVVSKVLSLPIREQDPVAVAAARELLAEVPAPRWAPGRDGYLERVWCRNALLVSLDNERLDGPNLSYEIQAFRIGDVAVLGLPGEPFAEGAVKIKQRSPAAATLIAHCSTHYAGYLPTERAYDHGGHEVDPSSWSKLAKGALETVVEESVALLNSLFE